MANTIGSYAVTASLLYGRVKSTYPKAAEVFKELTQPKSAADFYQASPEALAAQAAADNPVYGVAQGILANMNGLAKLATDPSLSSEQRDYIQTQFNDLNNQLKGLGIGNDAAISTDPNSKLSQYDLGLSNLNLSDPANAQAAANATDAAFGGLIQQQSATQAQAYKLDNQDRENATQQFEAQAFAASQQSVNQTSAEDDKTNTILSAYLIKQDSATKRGGLLKLLA